MTRSIKHKIEPSTHMKSKAQGAPIIKKHGNGASNWGSLHDEITEGIDIVASGGAARGSATASELGMAKLSTSVGSNSSASSDETESVSSA